MGYSSGWTFYRYGILLDLNPWNSILTIFINRIEKNRKLISKLIAINNKNRDWILLFRSKRIYSKVLCRK